MESRPDVDPLNGEFSRHRDLTVLKWMGEQYTARLDHLEALIGRSNSQTRVMVRRMRDAGYVRTRYIVVGEPIWVVPTGAGLRACGSPYREVFPRSLRLDHVAATNDVRLHTHRRTPHAQWISRRQLLRESTTGANVPDALVVVEGRRAAIAVELATKPIGFLKARLEKLEEPCPEFVYFFCAPGPYRKLTRLQETGRWPKLELRELENLGGERP